MDILKSASHIAKKEYTCNYCNQKINVGQKYRRLSIVSDEFYEWINHIECESLASKLGWFDSGDGLTQDHFIEYVKDEYGTVMSENFNEQYESKDFKIPPFVDQLKFIIEFHGLVTPTEQTK